MRSIYQRRLIELFNRDALAGMQLMTRIHYRANDCLNVPADGRARIVRHAFDHPAVALVM